MLEPRDQHYKERVKRSFASQSAMATMNIHLISVKPGLIEMELRKNKNILQQQGFIHGGVIASALDSACGFAALTLSEKNYEVLTIEFKTSFFYPANSDVLSIKGKVINKHIHAPLDEVKTIKVETEIVNNIFEINFIRF